MSQRLPGLDQASVIAQIDAFQIALDAILVTESLPDRTRAQEAIPSVAGLDETAGDDVPRLKQQGETGTFQKVTMTSADMNDTPDGDETGGPPLCGRLR